MWNDEVTLIKTTATQDEYGNSTETTEETTLLCKKQSIFQNEFYQASQNGMKPSVTLIVHTYEYDGQRYLRFNGTTYHVIRTFEASLEETELTCEEKALPFEV